MAFRNGHRRGNYSLLFFADVTQYRQFFLFVFYFVLFAHRDINNVEFRQYTKLHKDPLLLKIWRPKLTEKCISGWVAFCVHLFLSLLQTFAAVHQKKKKKKKSQARCFQGIPTNYRLDFFLPICQGIIRVKYCVRGLQGEK